MEEGKEGGRERERERERQEEESKERSVRGRVRTTGGEERNVHTNILIPADMHANTCTCTHTNTCIYVDHVRTHL